MSDTPFAALPVVVADLVAGWVLYVHVGPELGAVLLGLGVLMCCVMVGRTLRRVTGGHGRAG